MPLPLLNNSADQRESGSQNTQSQASTSKISRIEIDRELCIGAESCAIISPDVFEMDDENIAVVKEGADFADYENIMEAAHSCPVAAVLVFDENGNQIYP